MMKMIGILIPLLTLIFSCQDSGPKKTETDSESLKKEVISIAEGYVKEQLKDAKTIINSTGLITIENYQKKFIIDPRDILAGFIDDDQETDAIITLTSYMDQNYYMTEHLILLQTEGKLMLIRSFEKDMKILRLKDRIITAEIHTKPRTSPLYSCASCKAIIYYRYSNGDLIKTD